MPSSQDHNFVHLHLHSAYSLAEGAIKVKDLIKLTKAYNMPAVAVTDTNNMFGAMEFSIAAAKAGLQPILGAQITVGEHQLLCLAQNETGYRTLCRLLSDAYMGGDGQHEVAVSLEALCALNEGLICLSGGSKGAIQTHLFHQQNDQAEAYLETLKAAFGDRLYIELQRHGLPEEDQTENALIELAYKHDVPLVATNDCYFAERGAHEAHDALLCIAEGRYITEDDRRKATPEHYFKSPEEMVELFKDVPEAIANTNVIAQRCSFLLEPIAPILPPFDTGEGRNEVEELRKQSEDGLQWRLEHFVYPAAEKALSPVGRGQSGDSREGEGHKDSSATSDSDSKSLRPSPNPLPTGERANIAKPYLERLEYELGIIEEMGFPGYFLIVSDFIKWAKDHNIPVGPGRGSGAGSVVAWSLKITDLDPIALGLLFERFLNPERVSMPDFDVDFCQDRRDEVIRYVQDKYGHDRVAQIITFGKLQARAVVRDVGRVLQMSYGQVDRLAKMIPNNPAAPMTLEEALAADDELRAERDKDETSKKLINIALQLEGLYRHASTHAAGVVIGDRPLHELIPLYRDPRSDMPVTQFNMKYVEQAGLVKFDFLGLKTMTVVQKTVELIKETRGEEIEILQVPLDNADAYELISRGDTVGVFQLESAGMRDMLRKVRPDKFEEIIALVSLYRPGPMDNIPTYISIKDGKLDPDYMHPKLQPLLEETYGIMIYQEQVMQAAQELAGYTLGGADLLRRAMGKKIQAEMDAQQDMFVKGSAEHNDVPKEQAEAIFDQIAKFAGYGFNKSHAAAYALIAYWTAYLKANYPVEFMAASMTLDLGNTDKLAIFKQDIDRNGLELRGPDINKSFPDFAVEEGTVRYALAALKGVGEAAMAHIIGERRESGAFKSLEDFITRLDPKTMNKRQFERMVEAGVFDSLIPDRAQLFGSSETLLRYAHSLAEERESGQVSLFGGGDDSGADGLGMPALAQTTPWDPLEQLGREFGAVGFYLSAHPLDSRTQQFENLKIKSYSDVEAELQQKAAVRVQMAGVLLKKQIKVSQKGSKYAFLQLSDPTGVYEVVLFSELLFAARDVLEVGNSLLLTVDAESKEDQIRFTVNGLEPLDEALEGKIKEIRITLDEAAVLPEIKRLATSGRSRVLLHVGVDNQRAAQVRLPGYWSLDAAARNELRTMSGVQGVSEG